MCAFRQTHFFSPKSQQTQVKTFTVFPQLASSLRGREGHTPREVRSGCAKSPNKQATSSTPHQNKGIKTSWSRLTTRGPIADRLKKTTFTF